MLNLFSYLLLLQSFSEEKYTIGDEAQTFSTKMKKVKIIDIDGRDDR